ncbi:MAG: hypothetical protein Q7J98_07480 [Kiritimatiellia bacterium]|nr:hypothetical protein [Kiritimatiellia bacterium]
MRTTTITAAGLVILCGGCATTRTDLARNGTVRIEKIDSHMIGGHIGSVSVYQDDGNVKMEGRLKGVPLNARAGDVEIEILDSDGKVLKKIIPAVTPGHQMHRSRSSRNPRFSADFPMSLSTGMVIHIMHK